ncbi:MULTISPECIES: magnesium/cobalt transporter CorA [unclassified Marinobacter]|uniref:magnesium/cobalt transporter CorA n=1 Tax=unclassified Marinobacter TaxID=83889 RepID=UPI0019256D73|nr:MULTISPECIES: magnesium/cobalt transporter CorA [unclassified Marinobacter]MBL3823291.1 magnesium/cobalt transporter CorA [Marinobacter sp. MC3]MBL3892378.1 magnesium/cobalt transporter CorA [Marinobacter sp. MW3]
MAYFSKHYHNPGTAPGTLVAKTESRRPVNIHLIDYTEDHVEEISLSNAADCRDYLAKDSRTWVQVNGQADPDTLRNLGDLFDLHDLALEDVLNTGQRPKLELYDDQLFIIAAMPFYDGEDMEIVQISLFVGKNYLICLCPLDEDPFEPVRKRMRMPNNRRFSSRGIDYLLYALLDLITDSGFPVLEQFGYQLEEMETDLLENPKHHTLTQIHGLKRELLVLRRVLWPQRELLTSLMRTEEQLINADTQVYFRDCHDHSVQIIELLESFREMATSMLDIYLSSISQRTNETMRVLTIIATIFIPLTFVVGIYGMNFEHADSPWAMPELSWYYGYPMVWAVMIAITGGLIWFFRRRGWM